MTLRQQAIVQVIGICGVLLGLRWGGLGWGASAVTTFGVTCIAAAYADWSANR